MIKRSDPTTFRPHPFAFRLLFFQPRRTLLLFIFMIERSDSTAFRPLPLAIRPLPVFISQLPPQNLKKPPPRLPLTPWFVPALRQENKPEIIQAL